MLAKVRAFDGLILIKNTHTPASCMSLVSVMKTLGLVLMLAACAPPGPSLTCSTEKINAWKIQYNLRYTKGCYLYMYSVHNVFINLFTIDSVIQILLTLLTLGFF